MGEFLINNILNIIFGTTTLITSGVALHYQRQANRRDIEDIIDEGRKVGLFLSREAMIRYLLEMYDKAQEGDVIWAQCVRCTDFTPQVRQQILKAAGRGVCFKMIVNRQSPAAAEFRTLFDPIESATLIERDDNAISLQGLADRELVISFPGVDAYTAVLIRDTYFVRLIAHWFETRLKQAA